MGVVVSSVSSCSAIVITSSTILSLNILFAPFSFSFPYFPSSFFLSYLGFVVYLYVCLWMEVLGM